MKPPNIELHIEELVLHGFVPGDRYAIAEAVELELTRLFAEYGAPATSMPGLVARHLDAGAFQVAANASTGMLGAQIAQAVWGGITR